MVIIVTLQLSRNMLTDMGVNVISNESRCVNIEYGFLNKRGCKEPTREVLGTGK